MKASSIYSAKQKIWGTLMILALLWLTVSLPFVYNAQQLIAKQITAAVPADDNPAETSEDANPLSNSVEEKASCSASTIEEYLHHSDESFSIDNPRLSHIDNRSYDLYIAFHGELLSPPPESLLS